MTCATPAPSRADAVRRRWIVLLLAAVAVVPGGGTAAQEGALFQPLEPTSVDSENDAQRSSLPTTSKVPTRGGETVRHREMRIDFDRLAAAKARIESGEGAALDLNLFDDVFFTAVDLRLARTSSGGYSLAGRLEGVLFGTATLVVNGKVVVGSIRSHTGTYTVDADGDVCVIREVDAAALPPLGEPLHPPQSMLRPRGGPGPAWRSGRGFETAEDDGDTTVTDVLVVYTPAVDDAVGGVLAAHALADLFVAETNQAYQDSGVNQEVFLTRVVEVDYVESDSSGRDLSRLANPEDGHMDEVHELREKTGSDLVHLIADVQDVCGIAYLMVYVTPAFESAGFGLTSHTCGGRVFAHELGHNMGLRHDRYVDSADTPYSYSHGYVNRAAFEEGADASKRWRTVMAYDNECSEAGFTCSELLRFSNADQEYEGDPLGIATGSDAADARRSLNETRHVVAGFRQAGPDLTATPLLLQRAWEPGQAITILGVVTNEGRIESAATTARFYRSADAVISADDTEVASFEVDSLEAKATAEPVHAGTAPDAGGYYYGICVDSVEGETDTDNCSAGIYVSVGPTVSVADSQTSEGETLAFSVTLSEARDAAVDVEWELLRETAVAGIDYADARGTVTIPAGQTSASVSVDTIADDVAEADDTFVFALVRTTPAPPEGVVLSVDASRATGTIVNDDGDPRFVDSGLREAVLWALGKPGDGDFTTEELASLRSLDATGAEVGNLGGLEAATGLRSLVLDDNEVSDLGPLGHLGDLRTLELDRNGFADLSGLAPLKGLEALGLSGNPVTDLSPLAGLTGLTRLSLDLTRVVDVSPLAGLTALETLLLDKDRFADADEAGITDISALAGLTRLTYLNLNFNDIVDISALAGLTRLDTLDLWGNEIEDATPLAGLVNLFWMDLDDNRISDIRPLAGLAVIDSLHLNGNAVTDLEPLAGLRSLRTLGLNGNGIRDVRPLAGLQSLELIWLGENAIADVSPLAGLDQLWFLDLGGNGLANISPLASLTRLVELQLQENRIRDISALAGLGRLRYLDISNNDIRDIAPLVTNGSLRDSDEVFVHGNPLNETSVTVHVLALIERGVDLTYIGVSVAAASAAEGGEMEFLVRLSTTADEDVVVDWTAAEVTATAGEDYPSGLDGAVTIAAGSKEASITVPTTEDQEDEAHEMLEISLAAPAAGFPDGVAISGGALGLIVDPLAPKQDVPVFAPAGDAARQGFVRVVNRTGRNVVHIVAVDDTVSGHSTSLAMAAGETVHFNSNDLESGNPGKGLSRGIGAGSGDWRLELSGNDVDVLAYMRTNDGFLTSLHDTVPAGADGYRVPILNPGKNTSQESLLKLINDGDADAEVSITGVDDRGESSSEAGLTLGSGQARAISAAELEKGTGLEGAMGTGSGKWRLLVTADRPILVASLMQTPTGHLTNLSTTPDNKETVANGTAHHVYLFPSASDAPERVGFVRVVNRGAAGSVDIQAYDETDNEFETVVLEMDAQETVHFNSEDLETGNATKGLSGSTGAGEGDWRLRLTSALDLEVLAYIRTKDGFLTSMHDTVPLTAGVYEVPIFNPGSNRSQVSLLRLVNTGNEPAEVTIQGVDDTGRSSDGTVRLSVAAGKTRTVTAQALESGADLAGALGDGIGKWRLDVNSDTPIYVLNLLRSPTGHITNLSTNPNDAANLESAQ